MTSMAPNQGTATISKYLEFHVALPRELGPSASLESAVLTSSPPPDVSEPYATPSARPQPRRSRAGRAIGSCISLTCTAALAIVGSAALVIALASHMSPQGQFVVFGHPVMSMISGSMNPAISTGDLVVDRSVSGNAASTLKIGQIITFRSAANSDKYFTHRIVAVDHTSSGVEYQTKGDENNAPDTNLVKPADVIGVFQDKISAGGYALSALHTPAALILIAMISLMFLFGRPLWRWAGRADAEARRRDEARHG